MNADCENVTPAERRASSPPEASLLSPFVPTLHPDADEVERRSIAWARRFDLCATDGDYGRLARSRIGRLAAWAYPRAALAGLQIAADWTTLFCLLDDELEAAGLSVACAAGYIARLSSAFRDGHADNGPSTRALVDLRARFGQLGDEASAEAFAASLDEILAAFLWEQINRAHGLCPSLAAYRRMRVVTVGFGPHVALARHTAGVDLSGPSPAGDAIRELTRLAASAVGVTNDLFTFERERAKGDVHNLVVLLSRERGLTTAQARRAAVEQHNEHVRDFLAIERSLPCDGEPQRCAALLRSWVGGHLAWAHETGRYQLPSAA